MKIPQYIFIHHTAVSYEKNPDQWKATENFHKSKGWGTGGYNYEVSAAGSIHQFREDGSPTAAQYQQSMNDGRALSIALDGNFDQEEPTDAQKQAIREFLKEKMAKYSIPKENVYGHRYLAPKTCPGKNITDPVYNYFVTQDTMEKVNIAPWATEAFEWVWDEGFAAKSEKETEDFQRMVVILHRYNNSLKK